VTLTVHAALWAAYYPLAIVLVIINLCTEFEVFTFVRPFGAAIRGDPTEISPVEYEKQSIRYHTALIAC